MDGKSDDKQILMIGKISSFLGKAIQTNLEASGYQIQFVNPVVNEISKAKSDKPIILLYLGDYVEKSAEVLVYIKDFCLEEEKALFLIGYDEEIKDVTKIIPQELVSGTFGRPLNVKEFVEKVDQIIERKASAPRKKHILIVDDSGQMLRTIKSWLDKTYQVSMANSGMSAITFLAKSKPDLILLDYEMPVCTGPQVLEMIRNETSTSDIPVIFLTSKSDKESVLKVVSLKPDGYLLKTKTPDEIRMAIADFFESKKGLKA